MPQEVGDLTELVAAARSGDHEAFEELVRVTYADTYTLAYRLTGDEEDARDVVQESYLRAFRGLKRFRGDAQFTTWLYRITRNTCLDLFRSGRRHALPVDPLGVSLADCPDPTDAIALGITVEAAMRSLPPRSVRVASAKPMCTPVGRRSPRPSGLT